MFLAALEENRPDEAIELLKIDVQAVSQPGSGLEWVAEPLEMGITPAELVDLLIEEKAQSPWIFYDPASPEPLPVDSTFHRQGCIHEEARAAGPRSYHQNGLQQQIRGGEVHIPSRDIIDRMVMELCGLAGIVPFRTRESWDGTATFNGTSASVVYNVDSDVAEGPQTAQQCFNALGRFMMAVAWLQRKNSICDQFVILRRDTTTSCIQTVGIPFCQIQYLQNSMQVLTNPMSTYDDWHISQLSAFNNSVALLELFCGERPELELSHIAISDLHSTLDACALAIQALCLGLLIFSHANAGELRPFFLEHGLSTVHLRGLDGMIANSLLLGVRGESLTCIGEMLNAPVMAFSCDIDRHVPLSAKYDLQTSLANLFEIWGPGNIIVDCLSPPDRNIIGVEIGNGTICRSGGDRAIFHWSQDEPPGLDTLAQMTKISIRDTITIGGLSERNGLCPYRNDIEQKPAAERIMPRQHTSSHTYTLGTFGEYWSVQQFQLGVQAGQYINIGANQTWVKTEAGTLKRSITENALDLDDLEAPWGLLISICTGVAQRAPLREVIAEVMLPIVDSWAEMPKRRWQHLLTIGNGIVEELRRTTFRAWFNQLPPDDQMAVILIAQHVLKRICWTGIDHKEHLVVACPSSLDAKGCVRIPCKDKLVWVNILKDSDICATFACLTTLCIQTDEQRCRTLNHPEWLNEASSLITAVCQYQWVDAEETKVSNQCIRLGKAYWMGYPGDPCRFVARVGRERPTVLRVSESIIPSFLRLRISEHMARIKARNTKLQERRLMDESHAEEVLLLPDQERSKAAGLALNSR